VERVTGTIPRFFIYNQFCLGVGKEKTNFYAKEIFVLRARMWYLRWSEYYKAVVWF